ncbi:SPOR domain-containing protein [Castellaniella caeni]
MATRKKKSSGGTWFGLALGMVLGVAAAVAVALFVTKAPMPFKDKATRTPPATLLPDLKNAPDPNIALYGKDGPAGTRSFAQGGSASNPPAPAPEPGAAPGSDSIGQLIAGLQPPAPPPPLAPLSKAPSVAAPTPTKPATAAGNTRPTTATPTPGSKAAASAKATYYLQTGAFRSKAEAQTMLARVVLLGLPVRIEAGESNGGPINRVRVGPFKGLDEMNRARTKLGDEKIDSSIVRP